METYRTGTVVDVMPQGTIVTVLVRLEDDRPYALHFDQRPFYHMVEDLRVSPDRLIGLHIEILHSDDGEYVRFPESEAPL